MFTAAKLMVVGGYLAVSDNPRQVENARAGDAISQILKNCSTGSCVHHLRVVDIFDSGECLPGPGTPRRIVPNCGSLSAQPQG